MTTGEINTILISSLIAVIGLLTAYFIKSFISFKKETYRVFIEYKKQSTDLKDLHTEKLNEVREDVLENRVEVKNILHRLDKLEK